MDAVGRALQMDFNVFDRCGVGRMFETEAEAILRRSGGLPVSEKQDDGLRALVVTFFALEGIGCAGNLELRAGSGLMVSGGAIEVNLDFEAELLQLLSCLHHFFRTHLLHLLQIRRDFALVERRIVFDGVSALDEFINVEGDIGVVADHDAVVDVVVGSGIPVVGVEGVEEGVNYRGELIENFFLSGSWRTEGRLGWCEGD